MQTVFCRLLWQQFDLDIWNLRAILYQVTKFQNSRARRSWKLKNSKNWILGETPLNMTWIEDFHCLMHSFSVCYNQACKNRFGNDFRLLLSMVLYNWLCNSQIWDPSSFQSYSMIFNNSSSIVHNKCFQSMSWAWLSVRIVAFYARWPGFDSQSKSMQQ